MRLPSIHTIRISLAEIDGALVDDPSTSPVDTGKIPCVQIHDPEGGVQPTEDLLGKAPSDEENDETDNDEASIIFEIPPELDDRQVREALSQHPGRDFERLVQLNGVDALGWYLPFHQQIAQHGIYISSAGALWLAKRCFGQKYSDDVRTDISTKLHYAVHAILRHETFHFAAECMAANWELSTGAPCYLKANKELKSEAGYIEKEEALANAYMLRGFRWASSATRGAKATHSLNAVTRASPRGYNLGVDYVASARYEYGCRDLALDYHERMALNRFAPRNVIWAPRKIPLAKSPRI
jgi:hypothetical protein